MKNSIFNVISKDKDELLVYNSLTGALAVFEREYSERMHQVFKKGTISMIPQKFIFSLKEDGFIVDANFDEHKKINDLVQRRINWKKSWHFSIMLNQSCNFKCFYCFQPRKKLFIMPAVEERIIKMIKLQCKKTDRISIDWYGGELLLSFGLFKKMNTEICDICLSENVDYEISLTTNGYLLDEKILEYLQSYNVTKGNKNSSFKIYELLENAGLKNKVEVSIRPVVSSQPTLALATV